MYFGFAVPLGDDARIEFGLQATDVSAAVEYARRMWSCTHRSDGDGNFVVHLPHDFATRITSDAVVYMYAVSDDDLDVDRHRAPGGPWWERRSPTQADRPAADGRWASLHIRVVTRLGLVGHAARVVLDGWIVGEVDLAPMQPYDIYSRLLAWADAQIAGVRFEQIDGVPHVVWADGTTRRPIM